VCGCAGVWGYGGGGVVGVWARFASMRHHDIKGFL